MITDLKWAGVAITCLLLSIIMAVVAEFAPYGKAASLDEVTELHFHKGRDTTYNRHPPLPQLTCMKGCEFQPDLIKCTNIKPRGRSSRWQCETDLPAHLKIDETSIICEGFHSDDDEEVLGGSCALEFTLTHAGWAPYRHTEKIASDPKTKGWSASWIVLSTVLGYLGYHIYMGTIILDHLEESIGFKNSVAKIRLMFAKLKRWMMSLQDQMYIDPAEKSYCRFNPRRKRDRNGVTHRGPDHCPDMPGH